MKFRQMCESSDVNALVNDFMAKMQKVVEIAIAGHMKEIEKSPKAGIVKALNFVLKKYKESSPLDEKFLRATIQVAMYNSFKENGLEDESMRKSVLKVVQSLRESEEMVDDVTTLVDDEIVESFDKIEYDKVLSESSPVKLGTLPTDTLVVAKKISRIFNGKLDGDNVHDGIHGYIIGIEFKQGMGQANKRLDADDLKQIIKFKKFRWIDIEDGYATIGLS